MKISVVMQSYLGDYPGARTNPEMKFIRAVYSMIGQSNPNWELIIAADGCKITERLYKEHFQHYSNIKFFMVEKPEDTTMNNKDRKYFRGKPRAVAVKNATGNWISYLDADDIYINTAIDKIIKLIKIVKDNRKDAKCVLNNAIIENEKELIFWNKLDTEKMKHINKPVGKVHSIPGLDGKWVGMSFYIKGTKKLSIPLGTYCLIHKNGWPTWEWGDSVAENLGEDNAFIKPMLKEGKHVVISLPLYVRCHGKRWDL